eukprot:FN607808.1.p2 GENE.FN607808.1~~FN607808.1.p2  ORF type:complete len:55 (+),score=3.06 FN607808.1:41-205(+)
MISFTRPNVNDGNGNNGIMRLPTPQPTTRSFVAPQGSTTSSLSTNNNNNNGARV